MNQIMPGKQQQRLDSLYNEYSFSSLNFNCPKGNKALFECLNQDCDRPAMICTEKECQSCYFHSFCSRNEIMKKIKLLQKYASYQKYLYEQIITIENNAIGQIKESTMQMISKADFFSGISKSGLQNIQKFYESNNSSEYTGCIAYNLTQQLKMVSELITFENNILINKLKQIIMDVTLKYVKQKKKILYQIHNLVQNKTKIDLRRIYPAQNIIAKPQRRKYLRKQKIVSLENQNLQINNQKQDNLDFQRQAILTQALDKNIILNQIKWEIAKDYKYISISQLLIQSNKLCKKQIAIIQRPLSKQKSTVWAIKFHSAKIVSTGICLSNQVYKHNFNLSIQKNLTDNASCQGFYGFIQKLSGSVDDDFDSNDNFFIKSLSIRGEDSFLGFYQPQKGHLILMKNVYKRYTFRILPSDIDNYHVFIGFEKGDNSAIIESYYQT